MVQRMLGEPDPVPYYLANAWLENNVILLSSLRVLDNIGRTVPGEISGAGWRMIHYANQVMHRDPPSIVEIGGGVGEFYAILRLLGWAGTYYIYDLPQVKAFQTTYLKVATKVCGIPFPQRKLRKWDFCCSFYALGEFDHGLRQWYMHNVVEKSAHGLMIWNPHSGADPTLPDFPWVVKGEFPLTHDGNKELTW